MMLDRERQILYLLVTVSEFLRQDPKLDFLAARVEDLIDDLEFLTGLRHE